jgi:hypothetical protein
MKSFVSLRSIFEQRMEKKYGYRGQDSSGDSLDFAWWHVRSQRNVVTDHTRASKFQGGLTSNTTAMDRSGNEAAPHKATAPVYDRNLQRAHELALKARQRQDKTDDAARQDYDLGRHGKGPRQNIGLTGTSIPTPPAMQNLKGVDDS